MICNFMIFSESVGSGACLSAEIIIPCKSMIYKGFFSSSNEPPYKAS